MANQRYVDNLGLSGNDTEKATEQGSIRRASSPYNRPRVSTSITSTILREGIFNADSSAQQTENLLITIVSVMGKITCYFNDPKVRH